MSLVVHDTRAALLVTALASYSEDLALALAWDAGDASGPWTGSLSEAMNMAGNAAGFIAPAVIGCVLAWRGHNWGRPFVLLASFYFPGRFSWLGIRARDRRDNCTDSI